MFFHYKEAFPSCKKVAQVFEEKLKTGTFCGTVDSVVGAPRNPNLLHNSNNDNGADKIITMKLFTIVSTIMGEIRRTGEIPVLVY